ncbi:hypothetical protein [Cellulosilyticum sp. WCF-2]|nr:hypothetical protein [Cellulosilyticum sp. WCF-2]
MLRKALMLDEFKEACKGATKKEILEDILAGVTAFVFIFALAVFL